MKYVYKIVAALGALSVIPMLGFLKIFYYKASSVAVQILAFIANMKGNADMEKILAENGGNLPENIADTMSVYDLVSLLDFSQGFSSDAVGDKFDLLIVPGIVLGVIAVMLVVCAIVTAVFAFAAKNNRMVIYSSVCGIGLTFMFSKAFEAVAAPFLDQSISLSTIFDSMWASFLGEIEVMTLTNEFWFIAVVFLAVIIWTVLYNITLPENEKKERKLMLGEED
ncbi:MAG: hypothetical protein J6A43_06530 [Clostridia bacterium]|nr:hypothetical protein [Clostridia bacterium]